MQQNHFTAWWQIITCYVPFIILFVKWNKAVELQYEYFPRNFRKPNIFLYFCFIVNAFVPNLEQWNLQMGWRTKQPFVWNKNGTATFRQCFEIQMYFLSLHAPVTLTMKKGQSHWCKLKISIFTYPANFALIALLVPELKTFHFSLYENAILQRTIVWSTMTGQEF